MNVSVYGQQRAYFCAGFALTYWLISDCFFLGRQDDVLLSLLIYGLENGLNLDQQHSLGVCSWKAGAMYHLLQVARAFGQTGFLDRLPRHSVPYFCCLVL